jgi:hypothetical protein
MQRACVCYYCRTVGRSLIPDSHATTVVGFDVALMEWAVVVHNNYVA